MATEQHTPTLLPCPFCGSCETSPVEDVVHVSMNEHDWRDPSWTVQCDGCTATMGYSDSEDEAIDAWNRRAVNSYDAMRAALTGLLDNLAEGDFISETRIDAARAALSASEKE